MRPINWGGQEATDPRFLNIVKNWIIADGEIYVRVYHAKAGGASDELYFNTYFQFVKAVNSTWGNCNIEIYRHPKFSLRGIITDDFIATAKNEFAEGKDWFLLILEKNEGGWKTIRAGGGSKPDEFDEELRGFQGKYAMIGLDIHWPIPPHEYPGEWVQGDFDRVFRKDEIPMDSASEYPDSWSENSVPE
jgi:hypothetical protein